MLSPSSKVSFVLLFRLNIGLFILSSGEKITNNLLTSDVFIFDRMANTSSTLSFSEFLFFEKNIYSLSASTLIEDAFLEFL